MKTAHQHNASARFTFTAKEPRERYQNVIASVVYHEWYGHIKMGYSGCDGNKTSGCDHYKCYDAVINSPIFSKTTNKYQQFYKEMYDHYIK